MERFDYSSLRRKMENLERSIADRLKAIERRVEQRIRDVTERLSRRLRPDSETREVEAPDMPERAFAQAAVQAAPPFMAKIDLYKGLKLEEIDEWYDGLFQVSRHFQGENLAYPTFFCESLEEFFEPHVKYLSISKLQKRALIEMQVKQAKELAASSGGGIFGVNWPGDGCYLNGWLFAYPRTDDPRWVLGDEARLPSVAATVAHEKLGHGFLSEFTSLGREREKIQLSRYRVAEDFDIRLTDSPESVLLQEKWETLFLSSMYIEEGYATWIESRLLEDFFGRPKRIHSAARVIALLEELIDSTSDREVRRFLRAVHTTVKWITNPEPASSANIHARALLLEGAEQLLAPAFNQVFGQPPRYVIGEILVDQLERRLGTFLVPYAMAVIFNVEYSLDKIANSDLRNVIGREPRMNLHSRAMLMLTMPDGAGASIRKMLESAAEHLSFAVPANIKP